MTAPRQIEPSMTFFVTVRAVSRSHRFVPKPVVVDSLDFAVKATAAKYRGRIALHEYEFLSNHFHLLGTDVDGCLPDFMRDLNALLSKQLNALRGTRGTNIEKDYNLVVVNMTTGDRAVEHAVYILANAVQAHLVERTSEWQAPNSFALEYGQPVVAERPEAGLWLGKLAHAERDTSRRSKRAAYAGKSTVPKRVEFELVRPPARTDLCKQALLRHPGEGRGVLRREADPLGGRCGEPRGGPQPASPFPRRLPRGPSRLPRRREGRRLSVRHVADAQDLQGVVCPLRRCGLSSRAAITRRGPPGKSRPSALVAALLGPSQPRCSRVPRLHGVSITVTIVVRVVDVLRGSSVITP